MNLGNVRNSRHTNVQNLLSTTPMQFTKLSVRGQVGRTEWGIQKYIPIIHGNCVYSLGGGLVSVVKG